MLADVVADWEKHKEQIDKIKQETAEIHVLLQDLKSDAGKISIYLCDHINARMDSG